MVTKNFNCHNYPRQTKASISNYQTFSHLQATHLTIKDSYLLPSKIGKHNFYGNGTKKQADMPILTFNKIDLKQKLVDINEAHFFVVITETMHQEDVTHTLTKYRCT